MLNERGAGRSEIITDTVKLGIDSYVRDLEALRQHFALRRMALIGLSWGSAVVAKYAASYPESVSRVVFLSPMGLTKGFQKLRTERLVSLLRDGELRRLQEIDGLWDKTSDADLPALCRDSLNPVLRLYVEDEGNLSRTRGDLCGYAPDALRNMNRVGGAGVASLGEWDFQPNLKSLRMPVLVIEGERSKVPLDDARTWARTVPNGRLLLIPNAGHMNWLDQPDALISALDQFLRGKWPTRARR